MRSLVRKLLPPLAFDAIHGVYRFFTRDEREPTWCQIKNGVLAGQWIYVNKSHPLFASMVEGAYDASFLEYAGKLDLKGNAVCDVGAHIGFHTMALANLVGNTGRVFAFEPNPYNLERLRMNLGRNPNLADRVHVCESALSDQNGETVFNFSHNVDDSTSSGGYIDGAYVPLSKDTYTKARFVAHKVRTRTLDDLFEDGPAIALMKIDVEGAEHLVIKGAQQTIKRNKPILLIEIHSVMAMLEVTKQLLSLLYHIIPLEIARSSRCFVVAKPEGVPTIVDS